MSEFNQASMKRAARKRAVRELHAAIERAGVTGAVVRCEGSSSLYQYEIEGVVHSKPREQTLTLVFR